MNNQEMAKDEKSIEKDKNEEKKMSSKKRTKLQIKFGLEILKERKKNKIGLKRFKKHFLRKCKATEHPGDLFDGAVNTVRNHCIPFPLDVFLVASNVWCRSFQENPRS